MAGYYIFICRIVFIIACYVCSIIFVMNHGRNNIRKGWPGTEANLDIVNPMTGTVHTANFVVVPNDYTCLLGLKTVRDMNLITINNETFIANVVSEELGDLGECSLTVDPNIQPKALPCRKLPLAIENDVQKEIDNLVNLGVLVPVKEPTK